MSTTKTLPEIPEKIKHLYRDLARFGSRMHMAASALYMESIRDSADPVNETWGGAESDVAQALGDTILGCSGTISDAYDVWREGNVERAGHIASELALAVQKLQASSATAWVLERAVGHMIASADADALHGIAEAFQETGDEISQAKYNLETYGVEALRPFIDAPPVRDPASRPVPAPEPRVRITLARVAAGRNVEQRPFSSQCELTGTRFNALPEDPLYSLTFNHMEGEHEVSDFYLIHPDLASNVPALKQALTDKALSNRSEAEMMEALIHAFIEPLPEKPDAKKVKRSEPSKTLGGIVGAEGRLPHHAPAYAAVQA